MNRVHSTHVRVVYVVKTPWGYVGHTYVDVPYESAKVYVRKQDANAAVKRGSDNRGWKVMPCSMATEVVTEYR